MIEVWFFADDRDETLAMCNTTYPPNVGEIVSIFENSEITKYVVVSREMRIYQSACLLNKANTARWNVIIKKL